MPQDLAPTTVPPLARETEDGFAVPQPGTTFQFPRDHGSHPAFKIEWWYITGHLRDTTDREYGFQATFFRRAGPRSASTTNPPSPSTLFRSDQIYLAHMAVLDVSRGVFLHQERLHRAGWNAGAAEETLDVHLGNWSLRLLKSEPPLMHLLGSIRAQASFDLRLRPIKPLVAFGDNGVSRKAADPTAASHYLTFTRLAAEGTLQFDGTPLRVTGQAWMDHEISSSQLSADQAGWDWASLQLEDGREVMVYQMRTKDGRQDPFSTLAWVDRAGQVQHQGADQFSWTPLHYWRSAATGASYPVAVEIRTTDPATGQPATFRLEPLWEAQELTGTVGGIPYWEGACRVLNAQGEAIGRAFLELTGYAAPLSDHFR